MANFGIFVGVLLLALQVSTCYGDEAAMFPYGPQAGDITVPDTQDANDLQLTIPPEGVVFFGRRHGHIALAYHGAFYFTDEYPAHHISAKPPRFHSPPFAAPLYYSVEFLADKPVGRVYYRYVRRNARSPNLNDLSNVVNGRVVGTTSFNATYGVIATWSNVTDSAAVERCSILEDPHACQNVPRNTFQAVLLADAHSTFVIFNYADVVEDSLHAKAGIYAGDNVRWTPVLPNNEQLIEGIERLYGTSEVMGRFIFKVNGNHVVRGGCTKAFSSGPLEASPKFAGMYGGEIIQVSGPCLHQQAQIQCKFGDTIVKGHRINDHKAECIVPILKQRGRISLSLSTSSPPNFNYVTDFTIVLPGRLTAGVKTDYLGPDQGWNETDASSLTLQWDNNKLSDDPRAKVQVNLVGYREDETQAYWTTLVTLADQVSNNPSSFGQSAEVTFDPTQFRCSGQQCQQYELGIIEVKLVQGRANTHRSLFSHNLPLGWFITDAMEDEHGHDWPSVLCTHWDERDKQDADWLEELLNCPCTMNQAMADFGRWQPDVGCNIFTGSKCTYHQGAVHCVRSAHPTPSGAGNQCCYSADGNLKYAADSYQGSTPDKGHAWGAAPYLKPGYVPEESHWIDDVVSFYYCCLWTEYKDCYKYMARRPTKDCVNYKPPGTAVAFGDPHINTFDGLSYRFHGRGEFTIIQVGAFVLQGRFSEHGSPSPINFNVSVLTGIAVKDKTNSDTVEVELAPANSIGDTGLDVIVNNEHINLTADSMHWQDFRGVSVVTEEGGKQKNVTLLLDSGIGVQVAASYGLLNVIVSLPPELKTGISRGLLGVWDGDQTNDFIPNGQATPIGSASSPQDIYNYFALSWEVAAEDSLFGDPEPRDQTFMPTLEEPTGPPPQGLESVCEDSEQCRYDYMVTKDAYLASGTFMASMWYRTLQDFLQPVDTCGLLDVPHSEKDSHDYTIGSTVHVTGCRLGLSLHGETTYTCDGESKQWQPEVTAKCEADVEDAGLGMKIGIGLGVVGGCAAFVLLIILITRFKSCRKSKDKGSASHDTELRPETRVPSRSEYAPTRTSEDIEDMRPKVKPRTKQTSENSV